MQQQWRRPVCTHLYLGHTPLTELKATETVLSQTPSSACRYMAITDRDNCCKGQAPRPPPWSLHKRKLILVYGVVSGEVYFNNTTMTISRRQEYLVLKEHDSDVVVPPVILGGAHRTTQNWLQTFPCLRLHHGQALPSKEAAKAQLQPEHEEVIFGKAAHNC